MEQSLEAAKKWLRGQSELTGYEIRLVNGELHMSKGSECFVRLQQAPHAGTWNMQHCHNREHWECLDFSGSLDECLDFLSDNLHFLFWEG